MSIKFTAIAAATLAVLGTASAADTSYFQYQNTLDDSSIIELGTVTAEGAGIVEIYDFRGGVQGALLGTETVNAGANADVRVNVNDSPNSDVLAILVVDGQTVATRDYDIK